MNMFSFIINAYELMNEIKQKNCESANDVFDYISKNKDVLEKKFSKDITGKDIVLKALNSRTIQEEYPDLSDFVRKNYLEMKIK